MLGLVYGLLQEKNAAGRRATLRLLARAVRGEDQATDQPLERTDSLIERINFVAHTISEGDLEQTEEDDQVIGLGRGRLLDFDEDDRGLAACYLNLAVWAKAELTLDPLQAFSKQDVLRGVESVKMYRRVYSRFTPEIKQALMGCLAGLVRANPANVSVCQRD